MNNTETLKLENINVTFKEKVIFQNLSFEFIRNNTYIINGKNGVGKTTLLNVISNYIQYEGKVVKDPKWTLDYLFQDDMLFSNITVRENLLLKYLTRNYSLDDFKNISVNALSTFGVANLIDQKVEMLSGGERQRVQLSQMLLLNSDIIILDEPLSKIDKVDVENICKTISKVFSKCFLIIVSHDNWYGNFIKLKLIDKKLKQVN